MKLSRFTLLLLFALGFQARAQVISIRIQESEPVNKFSYQALGDEAVVMTGDTFPTEVLELKTLEQITIENGFTYVRLWKDGIDLGKFSSLMIWTNDAEPKFSVGFERKKNPRVTYSGHLEIRPGSGNFVLINHVDLEDYICGVVHAEAGIHKSMEFFKVQAVSARTYALCHLTRHKTEGFNLCDKTHCQAYNGIPINNPMILEAVANTKNEVIVTGDSTLIEAVFSANCGGYTANSEDVWVKEIDYLRAVPDYNFCEGFNNHNWHCSYTEAAFLSRMGAYHKIEVTRYEIFPDVSGRVKRVVLNDDPKYTVTGEEVRKIFGLRSSKFHVFESGGFFFIEGEGFGHGVGMCQDGAYSLSEMGLDYQKIITHYYQDVSLRKLDEVKVKW